MNSFDNISTPVYRVLAVAGFYGPDDHLYELETEIYFDGEPNEEMEPLNEAARVRLNLYLDKLDEAAKEAATKAGKAFVGRPRNLEGGLELATAVQRAQTAVMGHLANRDTTAIIGKVEQSNVPETGSITPRKRGRPLGTVKTKGSLAVG